MIRPFVRGWVVDQAVRMDAIGVTTATKQNVAVVVLGHAAAPRQPELVKVLSGSRFSTHAQHANVMSHQDVVVVLLRQEVMTRMPPANHHGDFRLAVTGCALLKHVTVQRVVAVFNWMPPVVSASLCLLAKDFAILLSLDEKFDVEEVVFAQSALQVVNHSFGATPEQITKLRLLFIL